MQCQIGANTEDYNKAGLEFAKNTKKKPAQLQNTILGVERLKSKRTALQCISHYLSNIMEAVPWVVWQPVDRARVSA